MDLADEQAQPPAPQPMTPNNTMAPEKVVTGPGYLAQRRSQSRRAANRKKEAGFKWIRLTVPCANEVVISRLIAQILVALQNGALPKLLEQPQASDNATLRNDPASPQPVASERPDPCYGVGRVEEPDNNREAVVAPHAPPQPDRAPTEVAYAHDGDHAPLFDDIRAADWLARR